MSYWICYWTRRWSNKKRTDNKIAWARDKSKQYLLCIIQLVYFNFEYSEQVKPFKWQQMDNIIGALLMIATNGEQRENLSLKASCHELVIRIWLWVGLQWSRPNQCVCVCVLLWDFLPFQAMIQIVTRCRGSLEITSRSPRIRDAFYECKLVLLILIMQNKYNHT